MGLWGDSKIAKRLLTNSGWLFGAEAISLVLKLASGFVLAHGLGVTGFGRLALITAFVTLIAQIIDFRAWETAIRYVLRYRTSGELTKARAVIKLCYLLDLGGAALAWVLAVALAGLGARLFVGDDTATPLIRLFALIVMLGVPIATSSALLRAADLFRPLAIKNTSVNVIRSVALIIAATSGASLHEIIVVQLAATAIDGLASVALVRLALAKLELSGWSTAPLSGLGSERPHLGRFLAFTNLAALLKVLQSQLDVLLVGYFLPVASAGYIQLARSITDAMRFLAVPVSTACYPEYVQLWDQRAADEARRLTRTLLSLTSGLGAAALIAVVVIAEPAVRHLAGPEYLPAVRIVQLLAIGTAIEIPSAILHPLLVAATRTGWSMAALAIAVCVRVAALGWLLPSVGALGVGFAHIAYIVVYVLGAATASTRALVDLGHHTRRPA